MMNIMIFAALAVIMAACTSNTSGNVITLGDALDFSDFEWTCEPGSYAIKGDTIEVVKGSIEYENGDFQHLGSVATNNVYSDWATTAIPADVKEMWYRLSRRDDDFCIECSADGQSWSQMRVCHMYAAKDRIRFGIYACSPEESSFRAVFTDMQMTGCMWKAHDGQQPDDE